MSSSVAVPISSSVAVPSSPKSSAPSAAVPAGAPRRIVSLSPSATEDLYVIGAGSQVVAVDSDSNYPADAPKTALSAYKPNVEAIARFRPDLVVISNDTDKLKAQLTALKIPVLMEPAAQSLDDTYQQIRSLGEKTGHADKAATVVSAMRSKIAALVATVPTRRKPLTYFHELDNTLYTVTSKTFIGQIYKLAGFEDVADTAGAGGGEYPQLSAEFLVKSNPDLVFLADTKCCGQNASTFAARPGFGAMTAVKDKHIVRLDDDIASRWGPRVVDLLEQAITAGKAIPAS
ncbi:MAG: ABC transporter substrate-binding protein [Actinomycetota bacterium]|nr:ABC transporter substrate-binding protein [Actinomycetota bacterium]